MGFLDTLGVIAEITSDLFMSAMRELEKEYIKTKIIYDREQTKAQRITNKEELANKCDSYSSIARAAYQNTLKERIADEKDLSKLKELYNNTNSDNAKSIIVDRAKEIKKERR